MIPHGAIQPAELEALGVDPETVIDFSSNVNPYGPSPRVLEAIKSALAQPAIISRYPDPDSLVLRRQISLVHNISLEQILVGNGSVELLWLIAMAFLDDNQRALVLGPTFGEYEHTAHLVGASVKNLVAEETDGFKIKQQRVAEELAYEPLQVVYLCNPNNPTGTVLPAQVITDWARQALGTLFVVDEAYIDFTPEAKSVIGADLPNVLVLRSLTKAHSLAGLRLGYLVGQVDIVTQLRSVCPPWSVNAVAQVAGMTALQDSDFLTQSLSQLHQDCRDLRYSLSNSGLTVMPSKTNYFLANVGDARAVRMRLLEEELMVRDCTSFGLSSHIRVATRRPEENRRLVAAMARLAHE